MSICQLGVGVKASTEKWLNIVSGRQSGIIPGLTRFILRICSYPYSWYMQLRNQAYQRGWAKKQSVTVPVIVVGNLTTGGTGKTPVVEFVARWFRDHELQVAILSRGYGNEIGRNDEALVLEENLPDVPHLQGADRVALAQMAIEELETELLVLDDGFQHRRLQRDLDIVLIDATCPWGYGFCLPGGLLREPVRGIRRAGLVVITRVDQVNPKQLTAIRETVREIHPACPVVLSNHVPRCLQNTSEQQALDELKQREVLAFCGIGNPEAFWQTLRRTGCNILDTRIFPDHFNYQRHDVEKLAEWVRLFPQGTWVVTTQKDFVKLRIDDLGGKPLWSLPIALEVCEGREHIESALSEVLSRCNSG
ncbi:MAG: tetraacyldisaccharide 4'-kinase [Gemmatales bacterium]